jgi:hypothetical protein
MNTPLKFSFLIAFLATLSLYGQHVTEVPIQQDVPLPVAKSLEELEAARKDSICKMWTGMLVTHNQEIDKLKENVFDIDTLKASRKEAKKLIAGYKIDLQNIAKKFANAKSEAGNSLEIVELEGHFIDQQSQIEKQFIELQDWADSTPPSKNWFAIFGISLGGILAFSMTLMPILMKKATDKKQKKTIKEAEWQTFNAQYQQLPPKLEQAHLPLVDNLILQYTHFVEKPPKKLHKNDALAKIKILKMKKLKIGPVINIAEKI